MSKNNFKFFKNIIEAIIFSSSEPVKTGLLQKKVPSSIDLFDILEELQNDYLERGVNLEKIEDSWAFRTSSHVSENLIIERIVTKQLSRPALETLSIIAYHQPITRSEIENIRGVSISKGTLDNLLELEWIKPKGRRKSPGRPLTWGTTEKFLDVFGLQDISSLPGISELKSAGLIGAKPLISEDISQLNENISDESLFVEEFTLKNK